MEQGAICLCVFFLSILMFIPVKPLPAAASAQKKTSSDKEGIV